MISLLVLASPVGVASKWTLSPSRSSSDPQDRADDGAPSHPAAGTAAAFARSAAVLSDPQAARAQCAAQPIAQTFGGAAAAPPRHALQPSGRFGRATVVTGLQEHCDLLPNSACKAMDAGDRSFPDGWLEETLEVALHGCHKAPCFALDIGANIGLVALRMICG